MKQKTEDEYRNLARHFYSTVEPPLTPKRLADALKEKATETTPAYWRRLRRAITVDQKAMGFDKSADRISKLKNPATKQGTSLVPGEKRLKAKAVSDADTQKVLNHFKEKGDRKSMAVIHLIRLTGVRPAEIANMQINQSGTILRIHGAKKSEIAQRGADRDIVIPDNQKGIIKAALFEIQGRTAESRLPVEDVAREVRNVQARIGRAGRAVFPRRKYPPVAYSWRHQLGSNLKAGSLSRKEIAYIMGHQSTASVDKYGDRRKAQGSAGSGLRPTDSADLSMVRENNKEPGQIAPAIRQAESAKSFSSPEYTRY